MKVVIAGGTGFIGSYLSHYFAQKGNEVVILSRSTPTIKNGIKFCQWDGKSLSDWSIELENSDLLINLSGTSVAVRHNQKNKKKIYDSRILSTQVLNKAVSNCENPPKYWFNSSGASVYKTSLTESRDESYTNWEKEFLTEVVLKWEEEFFKNPNPKVKKVAMRTSVVFGKSGETYEKLNLISKIGLGGKQGSGKQIMSWIHIEDYARIIEFCMKKNLEGIINMAAPNPVTNQKMMQAFREVNRMPIGIPAPEFLIRIGTRIIGIEPDFVLKSYNVISKRLQENGFEFKFTTIQQTLENLSHS